jgi:hypothetical protein
MTTSMRRWRLGRKNVGSGGKKKGVLVEMTALLHAHVRVRSPVTHLQYLRQAAVH